MKKATDHLLYVPTAISVPTQNKKYLHLNKAPLVSYSFTLAFYRFFIVSHITKHFWVGFRFLGVCLTFKKSFPAAIKCFQPCDRVAFSSSSFTSKYDHDSFHHWTLKRERECVCVCVCVCVYGGVSASVKKSMCVYVC